MNRPSSSLPPLSLPPSFPALLLAFLAVLSPHIGDGKAFPYDSNGIYFLLTSSDVLVNGLCTSFCGFHWYGSLEDSSRFVYSYVGMPGQCLYACAAQ